MAVDFSKILSKSTDEIEKPKPLPAGTWDFQITGHEFGESTQKGTPFVRFTFKPVSPGEDVDEDALEQFGGAAKAMTKEVKDSFYLTDDAMYRLKQFLEMAGVNISGRTLAEAIPETTNAQVRGNIVHQPNQRDPETVYANIQSYAPVE